MARRSSGVPGHDVRPAGFYLLTSLLVDLGWPGLDNFRREFWANRIVLMMGEPIVLALIGVLVSATRGRPKWHLHRGVRS